MGYKRRPQTVICPVCEGRIAPYLLDWHLNKHHAVETPMALDGGDAAAQ